MVVIGLTLAHRFMSNILIAAAKKGDLATARTVVALRNGLKLREAAKIVDEINEKAKAIQKLAGTEQPFIIRNYDDMNEFMPESETYECDAAHLKWLLDIATNHDWSKVDDQSGKEIKTAVGLDIMATFADLVDQLQSAI